MFIYQAQYDLACVDRKDDIARRDRPIHLDHSSILMADCNATAADIFHHTNVVMNKESPARRRLITGLQT